MAPLDTVTRVPFNFPRDYGWCDVGQFVVGVAFVGLEWPTVTAVVMVIVNVTKITD